MAAQKKDLRPQELNLKIYSGDGYRFRLIIKDKDGVPVPLTGEFKAQIRSKRGTSIAPETSFDIDNSDFSTGKVGLILTGAKCQELTANGKFKGFWDVQWTPADAEPKTLVRGKLECDPDVSR